MTLFQNRYRVESNRMQIWDYSSPASYFITVCTHGRDEILGKIENSNMILSDSGHIVFDFFKQIPTYHKRIILDEYIIMPNHFHCLITLNGYSFNNGVSKIDGDGYADKIHEFYLHYRKTDTPSEDQIKEYRKLRRNMLIPKIIGKFKMQTSKQINISQNSIGNKIWQHDYYDHIVKNETEYYRIKNYIKSNPSKWVDNVINK